jgi:hypothetical protein
MGIPAEAQATNLPGRLGVIPADKHPPGKGNPMFRINLKSSIATVAVIAGVLAAAGSASASSTPVPAHAITMLDYHGSPLKSDSNEVAVEGVTAKTSSLTEEGYRYVGVARTSAGFKSLSGMDSETEFMDYTDDSLLD